MNRHRAEEFHDAERVRQDQAWNRFIAAHLDEDDPPRHRDHSWSRGVLVLSGLLTLSVVFSALALALPRRDSTLSWVFLMIGCVTLATVLVSSFLAWLLRAK